MLYVKLCPGALNACLFHDEVQVQEKRESFAKECANNFLNQRQLKKIHAT